MLTCLLGFSGKLKPEIVEFVQQIRFKPEQNMQLSVVFVPLFSKMWIQPWL